MRTYKYRSRITYFHPQLLHEMNKSREILASINSQHIYSH